MRGCRGGLRVGLCLAGLLLAAGTLGAGQVDRVSLCEGAPDCDGADIRIQADIPSNGNLGFSMAMGYLDGDRFADLIVGAPDAASVYVFFGGVDNNSPAEDSADRGLDIGAADLVITGDSQSQLGFSVAAAPRLGATDWNNALIVGAPASDDAGSAGNAYVIPASFFAPSRPTGTHDVGSIASVVLNGAQPGDEAGYSVALGPVRTDGADDIVVGARLANGARGAVYVVVAGGGDSVVDLGTEADVTVIGALDGEGVGEFLAVADFYPASSTWELAVGAVGTGLDETLPGRVYLLDLVRASGANIDLANMSGWRIEGNANDFFGFSFAAGDFDGNGDPDLAVGAIYADRDTTAAECPPEDRFEKNSGAIYLFSDVFLGTVLSSAPPPPLAPAWQADGIAAAIFLGDAAWDELGFGLAAADVNSDNDDDLIATARRHDRGYEVDQVDEGAVYVFHGPVFVTGVPILRCLDCGGGDCSTGSLPIGVNAMLFGGDYDLGNQSSDEVGFSVAAGDFNFNENAAFDDIAVSSVTHERVYVVALENSDATTGSNPDGQATDDYRDIRDRDDDGDGYADTDEDENGDGVLNSAESDPYLPNRDVTVSVDPQGALSCDGTVDVEVTVTNAGPQLSLSDPRLRVSLPDETQPVSERPVFEYVPQSTTIDGNSIDDLSQRVCQNAPSLSCTTNADCRAVPGVGGACSAFPFVDYRSLTASGTGPLPSPLPGSGEIVVRFRLMASLPLEYNAPTQDDVLASVELDPALDPDELPYPHATSGLSEPNNGSGTVTMVLPDLVATKSSTDLNGGEVIPGDRLEYTLTISNTGPRATYDAGQVDLSDAIPADASLVPLSATTSQGTVIEGDPLTASLGTIAVGFSATVTFQVEIDEQAADGTVIENGATITESCLDDRVSDSTDDADNDSLELGNDPGDPFDDDSAKDEVVARAEIAVVKSADRSTAEVGDVIGYSYALTTGGGNVRLNNVSLTDDLCGPVVFQGGDTNSDGHLDWAGSGSGAETWIYVCAYAVQSTDPVGPLVNTATARGVAPSSGQVNDTDSATVTIDNTPPVANDDADSTDTDTAVAVLVLVNDSDANGHTLTITDAQSPTSQGGSATINDNGTPVIPGDDFIDYDPPAGFDGTDTFTYTIDDGFGGNDTATVTVTVGPPAPWTVPDPSFESFDSDWLEWSPSPLATGYHLYRGDLAVVRSGGAYVQDPGTTPLAERMCWLTDTRYEDTYVPPMGETVFYLVTTDDGSREASLGSDSEGNTRPNDYSCR
jgi:uncharacterized repeat protein (TIGR01451 family)